MGHSQLDKKQSHERIVRIAAARFREAGVDGLGLAQLMSDAGLTHGGFYRHFTSREELVAEAIECALRDGGRAVAALANLKRGAWRKLVDAYLSPAHRDGWATSCAVTTLAADVARSNARARSAYTKQVGVYLALLAGLLAGGPRSAARSRRKSAIAALSMLVGAVSMARAVHDKKLSQEILQAAASELKSRL